MESDMPCPKDGTEYISIGDSNVCPKCGHVAGYKQFDIVKLLKENAKLKSENDVLNKNAEFYKKMWLSAASTE